MNNNSKIETNFNIDEFVKECLNIELENEDFEDEDIKFKTPNEAFQYINDNCERMRTICSMSYYSFNHKD